jgi:hypothetical protein
VKARIAPGRYDIEAYRGDTISLPFQARDQSGPVDLTSHTITAQVRRSRLATAVDATFQVFIEDAPQGHYTLVLSPAGWADITCGESAKDTASKYVWDVQITSPSGEVSTPHAGAFTVFADVTRVTGIDGGDTGDGSTIVLDGGGV